MTQQTPDGYTSIDEAVRKTNYSRNHLNKLGMVGTIRRYNVGNNVYLFSADLDEYLHPKGFLTLKQAAEMTGYNWRYFNDLANNGLITSRKQHGKVFVSEKGVKKYILKKGYISQKEAIEITKYTADHLRREANRGIIRSVMHHHTVFFNAKDIKNYRQPPRGFLSYEEAHSKSGYAVSTLSIFATNGVIRRVNVGGINYVSLRDIEQYKNSKKPPIGFLSTSVAAKKVSYSQCYVVELAVTKKIDSVKINGKHYVSYKDLRNRKNPKIPRGYLSIVAAATKSGYARATLNGLAAIDKVKNVKIGERCYVLYKDVRNRKNPKIPRGYLSIVAAATKSGYARATLNGLAAIDKVKNVKIGERCYVSYKDVRNRKNPKIPRGYLSIVAAATKSGYKKGTVEGLARDEKIRKVIISNRVYVSQSNLDTYRDHPGYISLEDIVKRSKSRTLDYFKGLIKVNNVRKVKRRNKVYYSVNDLKGKKLNQRMIHWYDKESHTHNSGLEAATAIQASLNNEGFGVTLAHVLKFVNQFEE
jgi:hypothetical protein